MNDEVPQNRFSRKHDLFSENLNEFDASREIVEGLIEEYTSAEAADISNSHLPQFLFPGGICMAENDEDDDDDLGSCSQRHTSL